MGASDDERAAASESFCGPTHEFLLLQTTASCEAMVRDHISICAV